MTQEVPSLRNLTQSSDPNCPECKKNNNTQEAAMGCGNIDSYVVTMFSGGLYVYCGFSCPDGSVKERGFDAGKCPDGHIF